MITKILKRTVNIHFFEINNNKIGLFYSDMAGLDTTLNLNSSSLYGIYDSKVYLLDNKSTTKIKNKLLKLNLEDIKTYFDSQQYITDFK